MHLLQPALSPQIKQFNSIIEMDFDIVEEKPLEPKDFSHIVDFEPKKRDLYQAVTFTVVRYLKIVESMSQEILAPILFCPS
jgi:hypothetical protein